VEAALYRPRSTRLRRCGIRMWSHLQTTQGRQAAVDGDGLDRRRFSDREDCCQVRARGNLRQMRSPSIQSIASHSSLSSLPWSCSLQSMPQRLKRSISAIKRCFHVGSSSESILQQLHRGRHVALSLCSPRRMCHAALRDERTNLVGPISPRQPPLKLHPRLRHRPGVPSTFVPCAIGNTGSQFALRHCPASFGQLHDVS